jgi:hypothetical protein
MFFDPSISLETPHVPISLQIRMLYVEREQERGFFQESA